MSNEHLLLIEYNIIPLNFTDSITVNPYLDFNVKIKILIMTKNFGNHMNKRLLNKNSFISAITKKLIF